MTALFRQESLDNRRERLWGEVVLIQPLSFYLITGVVTIAVILIAIYLIYGTYARRENVSGYLLPMSMSMKEIKLAKEMCYLQFQHKEPINNRLM